MSRPFHSLSTVEEFDHALAQSASRPILIFKHSLTCGTSAMANEEMQDLLEDDDLPVDVYLLKIQHSRALSAEVSKRLNIRHESPQVLLIDKGALVWNGSHYHVTAKEIRQHLGRFAAQ